VLTSGAVMCPLAVFAPRHGVNLLRLKAFFPRQWQQMPAAQFMAVFGRCAARILQVLDRFDPTVLAAGAVHIADQDDELPLRPGSANPPPKPPRSGAFQHHEPQ
jgi:hypothetical protein